MSPVPTLYSIIREIIYNIISLIIPVPPTLYNIIYIISLIIPPSHPL